MTFTQQLTLLIITPISLGAIWFLLKIIIGLVKEAREEIQALRKETKDVWNRKGTMKHKTVEIERILNITGRGTGLLVNEPCSRFSIGDIINERYEVKYCEGHALMTSPPKEGKSCCLIVKDLNQSTDNITQP